ncbi:hypothetical protein [Arthrobacter cavernae]|uniref:VOC family protein n=1 Tax=Arthrobacter cavernae TaxID=2817681 RepID=A0A939HJR1_9MICC|nr:hypothetical protein [Arthrobacter cavernae]MBO1269800.1 hypothetical protein [Arthrobacter cavernae]
MLRVHPIHFTSRPEQWEHLLGALGLVKTMDDGDWLEFDAGSGRLAVHRAAHSSPEDGTTVFGVEIGILAEFARRTTEAGTQAEVIEAPHGSAVRVTGQDGFTFLAEQARRAADGTWATSAHADPALAVTATWLTPDVDGAARELRNIGARPRSDTDTTADFSTKNGGILRVVHGAAAESGDLAFEYDGGLEALLQRLTAAGVEARLDDEILHIANPDAATGAAPASIGITRAPSA